MPWVIPVPIAAIVTVLLARRRVRRAGVVLLALSLAVLLVCSQRRTVARWIVPPDRAYLNDFVFLPDAAGLSTSRTSCVIAYAKPPWDYKVPTAFADGHVQSILVEEFHTLVQAQGFADQVPP